MDVFSTPTRVDSEAGRQISNLETGWSPHLTKRIRTLLYSEPLLKLRLNEGYRPESLRHYDAVALALKVFDLIVEHTGLDQEMSADGIERELLPVLRAADEAAERPIDPARHRHVLQWLLDALSNQGRGPFELRYVDYGLKPEEWEWRGRPFQYISEHHSYDGRIVLRLSSEGANLFLNALDLDLEDAQVATSALIDHQLKRGRFDKAVEAAEQARRLSLLYRARVERTLLDTRRDLKRVDWEAQVPELLEDAWRLIDERINADGAMRDFAAEKLSELTPGSEGAVQVAAVVRMLGECIYRYTELHCLLIPARGVFLDEQGRQVLTRRAAVVRGSPLRDVLQPILGMPSIGARSLLDELPDKLLGLHPPPAFTLSGLLRRKLQPRREWREAEVPVEPLELRTLSEDEVWLSEDVLTQAEAWLASVEDTETLSSLLTRAAALSALPAVLEALALKAFRSFAPEDEVDAEEVTAELAGSPLNVVGFSGDDLILLRSSL